MEKKLLKRFTKKKLQKTNQKELRGGKVIKRKDDKLYLNGKDTIIRLIAGEIKKT